MEKFTQHLNQTGIPYAIFDYGEDTKIVGLDVEVSTYAILKDKPIVGIDGPTITAPSPSPSNPFPFPTDPSTPPPPPSFPPVGGGGDVSVRDIHNKTKDPCISKTVDATLKANNNIVGVIADIIKTLDKDDNDITVNVSIYDTVYNSNGKAGKTSNTEFKFNPVTNKLIGFRTDITLSQYHIKNASKEYTAIVLLHEVLHAYFRYSTATTEEFDGKDHSTIANNYIKPMAEFLNKVFNTPIEDAYALAWDSASDTKVYNDSTEFEVGKDDNNIPIMKNKSELSSIGTEYLANTRGKKLCD